MINLDSRVIDQLINNAKLKVVGKVEHGFGNDGFLLNGFTEKMMGLGMYHIIYEGRNDAATIRFIELVYLDQVERLSLFNLLRCVELIYKHQIKGLEGTQSRVLDMMFVKIKFAVMIDCGNVAKVYNKMHGGNTKSKLKQWVE